MKGAKAPDNSPLPGGAEPPPELGRGVKALIKGAAEEAAAITSHSTSIPAPALSSASRNFPADSTRPKYAHHLPRWFYFSADAIFCLLAAWIAFETPEPLSRVQVGVCALLVTAGALACLTPILADKKVMAQNLHEEKMPKWVMADGDDPHEPRRRYVIRLHHPFFVGEIVEGRRGEPSVRPLWIANSEHASAQELDQIVREAGQYFHWQAVRAAGTPRAASSNTAAEG